MTTMAYSMRVARTPKPHRLATRITTDCRSIIDQAMQKFGFNEGSVVELAIREFAEKRGISPASITYPEGGTDGQLVHENTDVKNG